MGNLALVRIYNHILDPPCSLSPPLPLSCLPHPPRDVIRPQHQSLPRSEGVALPDFRVPNAEGRFNHRSHFNTSSLPFLCQIEASLRPRNPMRLLRQAGLRGHLPRWYTLSDLLVTHLRLTIVFRFSYHWTGQSVRRW